MSSSSVVQQPLLLQPHFSEDDNNETERALSNVIQELNKCSENHSKNKTEY